MHHVVLFLKTGVMGLQLNGSENRWSRIICDLSTAGGVLSKVLYFYIASIRWRKQTIHHVKRIIEVQLQRMSGKYSLKTHIKQALQLKETFSTNTPTARSILSECETYKYYFLYDSIYVQISRCTLLCMFSFFFVRMTARANTMWLEL